MSNSTGKRDAQLRADRIRAFREELAQLEREGALALDPGQRASLDSYLNAKIATLAQQFDIDTTDSQKQISWGMRIASTLGGMALCAALFMFFLRFWGLIAIPLQIAILVITPLLLLAATEFAARRERTLYYAAMLSLVTFGSFVLGLNVLGSIFNMMPSRNALLVWGVFALVLAYTYRLNLPLAAGLLCLTGYLAANIVASWGWYWLSFGDRPETFLAGGAAMMTVPAIPFHRRFAEFHWLYRLLGLLTGFIAILILSEIGERSFLPFAPKTVEILYQVLGFAASGLAIWAGIRERLPGVVNIGAAFFALLVYLRFFHWWWSLLPGYVFFLILSLVSIVLLTIFRRLRSRMTEAVAL